MADSVVGPDLFEDDAEVVEAVDVALGERRFAGIGGTGGRSSCACLLNLPMDALRRC
jgi:hypothetical protein